MQTYMHYGLGFPGELLTEEEFLVVCNLENFPDTEELKIQFRSFTEELDGKDWGTVVLRDFGELPNAGKLCSLRQLTALAGPLAVLDMPTKAAIVTELEAVGLGHLAEKVELLIFADNY